MNYAIHIMEKAFYKGNIQGDCVSVAFYNHRRYNYHAFYKYNTYEEKENQAKIYP